MSSWADRWGQITVEQALELNKAAKWYCGHEETAAGGEDEAGN